MSNFRLKLLLIAFIILLILINDVVDAKKKKKKVKTQVSDPEKSSQKRPEGISPELYCNSCQAIIRELLKKLKHRKSESDVMDAMSETCEPEQYLTYEFPPPEMKQGCEAFIMDWEEVIERELILRKTNEEVENKVCLEISKACKGVNVKDAPKMDNQIFVDGQPVPIDQEGRVSLEGNSQDEL